MNTNFNNTNNNLNQNSNQISNQQILELAQLSCMDLSSEEQQSLADSLSETLEHFSIIGNVASDEKTMATPVERTASLEELRPDEASPWTEENLHSAAPDYEETYYFVPKVL